MSNSETEAQRAQRERGEELRRIPPKPATERRPGVRTIGLNELDNLGIDPSGNLYWHDKPLVSRSLLELRHYELILLTAIALGTLAMAAVAVLDWLNYHPFKLG